MPLYPKKQKALCPTTHITREQVPPKTGGRLLRAFLSWADSTS